MGFFLFAFQFLDKIVELAPDVAQKPGNAFLLACVVHIRALNGGVDGVDPAMDFVELENLLFGFGHDHGRILHASDETTNERSSGMNRSLSWISSLRGEDRMYSTLIRASSMSRHW
jgi:hypothetical protein